MRNSLILAIMLGVFALASCQKEPSGAKIKDINDLVIPAGFTWENSTDIYFDISVKDTRFADSLHVIAIYDADPGLGGRLLSKGSASLNSHFTTKIYLNNTIKEVFIQKTAPDNSVTLEKVAISGFRVNLTMAGPLKDRVTGAEKISGLSDSPNCSTGCTVSYATAPQNLSVSSGQVVCITGSNQTVGFVAGNGATVRICGTNVTLQNANLGDGATLIVTSTGSVTGSISMNGQNSKFTNYGTASLSNFAPGGIVLNEGTLNVSGDCNFNSQSTLDNNGTMTVTGSMNFGTTIQSTNDGSITINNDLKVSSSSTLVNNCKIWAKNNFEQAGSTKNYGYILVGVKTNINSSTELGMYGGAMLKTDQLVLDGRIKGYNSANFVKATGAVTFNSSGVLTGPVQGCATGTYQANSGTVSGGATIGCTQYIAVTNCNPEGNGTPPIVDTDGDGVNDTLDEYPHDATKAYNNYYPSVSPTSGATVAFEDQWPIKGDYDLNDVVVSYRYKVVTNAANKVVQLVGDYTLYATGSGYKNGFGVEFPILRSTVSGLSGGTLEAGQTNAVVILFTDIRTEMAKWNTEAGEAITTPKTYSITFNIASGPTLNTFGLSSYNPFIWNGGTGKGRTYEIHLPGKTPTSLANKAFFGTGDDNSSVSASRYYVTKNNGLPWAINIPIKPFSYPYERVDVSSAYLKFQAWAESGGAQFQDWYSNTETGYRNQSKIYSAP
jgi:LruC domain-containing protein